MMDMNILSGSADASASSSSNNAYLEKYFYNKASGSPGSSNQDHDIPDGMAFELLRLATFKNWPRWATMMPNRLARHGFFYTQQADETQCFRCKVKIRLWNEGDLPESRHQAANPNCDLLQKANVVYNVGLPRPASSTKTRSLPLPSMSTSIPAAATAATTTAIEEEVQPHFISEPITSSSSSSHTSPSLTEYKFEHLRRETFRSWPSDAYVGPDEMAQAGFIYLGSGDRVQCVFCNGILKNWVPGDKAFQEHQRKFPYCPFVKNPRIGAPQPIHPQGRRDDDNTQVITILSLGINTKH